MAGAGNRGIGGFTEQQPRGHDGGRTSGQGTRPEAAASGVVGNIAEKAQDLASNVAHRASDAWEATRHGAEQAVSSVADTAEDAYMSVRSCMSRYPFATFFAGFGLGFLLFQALQLSRSYSDSRGN